MGYIAPFAFIGQDSGLVGKFLLPRPCRSRLIAPASTADPKPTPCLLHDLHKRDVHGRTHRPVEAKDLNNVPKTNQDDLWRWFRLKVSPSRATVCRYSQRMASSLGQTSTGTLAPQDLQRRCFVICFQNIKLVPLRFPASTPSCL